MGRNRGGSKIIYFQVEGEKCADAAEAVLRTEEALGPLHAMTWPGGAKAIEKVDWTPLAGRSVVLWPDCDAQTASATQARKFDVEEGALLPEAEQPGVKAMERIAQLLEQLVPPAKVRMVKIPAPGEKPGGWDVADDVTFESKHALIRKAYTILIFENKYLDPFNSSFNSKTAIVNESNNVVSIRCDYIRGYRAGTIESKHTSLLVGLTEVGDVGGVC
jgi:hypothetical protein